MAPTCVSEGVPDACRRRPFAWPPSLERAFREAGAARWPQATPRARRQTGRRAPAGKPDPRSGGKPEQRGGKPTYERDRSKDRTRSTAGRWRRDDLPEVERTAAQAEYDGPPIPDDITGKELDPHVLAQLKSLPEKLAARVARHLVAAAQLMDSDPETAYKHTLAARARASRVSVVREASGEAAYASGKFKEALTEFKAARRMNHNAHVPADDGRLRARSRPSRAGAGAGQGPAGRSSSTTTARSR